MTFARNYGSRALNLFGKTPTALEQISAEGDTVHEKEATQFEAAAARIETINFRDNDTLTLRQVTPEDAEGILDLYGDFDEDELYLRFQTCVDTRDKPRANADINLRGDYRGLNQTAIIDPENRVTFVAVTSDNRIVSEVTYADAKDGTAEIYYATARKYRHRIHDEGPTVTQRLIQHSLETFIHDGRFPKGLYTDTLGSNSKARIAVSEAAKRVRDKNGQQIFQHTSGLPLDGIYIDRFTVCEPETDQDLIAS